MGASRSCSTSRSCGFHGGSWDKDGAAGPRESARTFRRVDSPSIEKTRTSFDKVHICIKLKITSKTAEKHVPP